MDHIQKSCKTCVHWCVFDSFSREQILRGQAVVGRVPEVIHRECCRLGHGVGTGMGHIEDPDPEKCGCHELRG